jgi:hypothetical protein
VSADTFILDGRAYSWRKLCQLRREQLEAIRQARGRQDALFDLKDDCRPASQRTAAGRYSEPTLLEFLQDR